MKLTVNAGFTSCYWCCSKRMRSPKYMVTGGHYVIKYNGKRPFK